MRIKPAVKIFFLIGATMIFLSTFGVLAYSCYLSYIGNPVSYGYFSRVTTSGTCIGVATIMFGGMLYLVTNNHDED